tara:strand:+ start:154 stop:609 length:456 start_codon:yes stop_codon:yes gene_type:complete
MTITRQTLSIKTRPSNNNQIGNTGSDNKYIRINNGKPYLEFGSVLNLLQGMKTPMIDGQSGIHRWLKDRSKGLNRISKIIDYSQEFSEEKIEKFIYDAISIYIFGEVGKFPVEVENTKDEEAPESSEDPDDMPPIDKGLDEIGITTNDFKL